MRQVLNFIAAGLALLLASMVFPDAVIFGDWFNFILTAFIFYLVEYLCFIFCIFLFVPGKYRNAPIVPLFIFSVIIAVIVGAIMLRLVCPLVSGCYVNNFWIALLVSAVACTATGAKKFSD